MDVLNTLQIVPFFMRLGNSVFLMNHRVELQTPSKAFGEGYMPPITILNSLYNLVITRKDGAKGVQGGSI